jgi:hypothetical protein
MTVIAVLDVTNIISTISSWMCQKELSHLDENYEKGLTVLGDKEQRELTPVAPQFLLLFINQMSLSL